MSRGSLVILLIDALGQELAETSGFLADRLPARRRLRSILGYSAAAIPSLLTGQAPRDHGHWFLYFRARRRGDSPFVGARWLARLPGRIANRWSVRRRLAEWWRVRAGIQGYFGLYEVPYRELADLDYVERLDTWGHGTFPAGSWIDDVAAAGLSHHVSDWREPDDSKFDAMARREAESPADVYTLYLTEIDARQHAHGSRGRPVFERLESYRRRLDELLPRLERRGPVTVIVCSDHGMTDIHTVLDPRPVLGRAGFTAGRDYRVFLDSTFLRFWCDRPAVVSRLAEVCGETPGLRVLGDDELAREGVDFPDDRYGRLLVLADPGVLVCPSDMGHQPLMGMHGYTPADAASDAVLLTAADPGSGPTSILHLREFFRAARPGPGAA